MIEMNLDTLKNAISQLNDVERRELISALSKSKVNVPPFPGDVEDECRVGRILIGKTTVGHQAKLEKFGYSMSIEDGTLRNKVTGNIDNVKFIFIDCNGFVDEVHINDLPQVAKDMKLIHYRTKIICDNGQIVSGIEAISLLGPWSCLMAAPLSTLMQDR